MQRHDPIVRGSRQRWREMPELAREILMDKKDVHSMKKPTRYEKWPAGQFGTFTRSSAIESEPPVLHHGVFRGGHLEGPGKPELQA